MAKRIGVWVVGACGSVSTCAIAGVEALKAGVTGRTGLVSELPEFAGLGLCGFDELVFGGHEVRATDLVKSAAEFAKHNNVLTHEILEAARPGLEKASANLRKGVAYPATLITTADHDDRVVPAHSFKFAARLQEVQSGDAPVLIRIEKDAGHGAGKPISKILDEQADYWAFFFANTAGGR